MASKQEITVFLNDRIPNHKYWKENRWRLEKLNSERIYKNHGTRHIKQWPVPITECIQAFENAKKQ